MKKEKMILLWVPSTSHTRYTLGTWYNPFCIIYCIQDMLEILAKVKNRSLYCMHHHKLTSPYWLNVMTTEVEIWWTNKDLKALFNLHKSIIMTKVQTALLGSCPYLTFILREWICMIRARASSLGMGNSILRSRRPERRSAGSRMSTLFVAAMTWKQRTNQKPGWWGAQTANGHCCQIHLTQA